MRTAALVLGIIGGVFGIIFALLAIVIGGAGAALGASGGSTVTVLGFIAFFLAVAGIVGAALSNRSPKASWILLIVCGIGGFICISAFWAIPGILFIVAAILEFVARKDKKPQISTGEPSVS